MDEIRVRRQQRAMERRMGVTMPGRIVGTAIKTLLPLVLAVPWMDLQAQPPWLRISPAVTQAFERIGKHPPVSAAMDALKGASARMFEEQVRLTEIPSPPFKEEARAKYFLGKVREAGLREAYIDKEGNVVALRKGSGGGPKLIASA